MGESLTLFVGVGVEADLQPMLETEIDVPSAICTLATCPCLELDGWMLLFAPIFVQPSPVMLFWASGCWFGFGGCLGPLVGKQDRPEGLDEEVEVSVSSKDIVNAKELGQDFPFGGPISFSSSQVGVKDIDLSVVNIGGVEIETEGPSFSSKGRELVCVDNTDSIVKMVPLAVFANKGGKDDFSTSFESSNWVLGMVFSFRHMVGLSCEGHEEELLALFTALEKECCPKMPCKSEGKLTKELKGLKFTINCDRKTYVSRKNRKDERESIKIK